MLRDVPEEISTEEVVLLENQLKLVRLLEGVDDGFGLVFEKFEDLVAAHEVDLEVLDDLLDDVNHQNQKLERIYVVGDEVLRRLLVKSVLQYRQQLVHIPELQELEELLDEVQFVFVEHLRSLE